MEESIFKKHIEKRNRLVKNKNILQTSYLPEELPHRTAEIDSIATIIATAFSGDKPSNIMIFGKPGTGKTAVMNFIGNELKKEDPDEHSCVYIYINCGVVDTQYGVLLNIGNQIIIDFEKRIPFAGWSIEKVYSEMRNYIDEQRKIVIVVLDELDRLVHKSSDDVLYNLSKINEDLKYSKLSLIGISNDLKFMEFLDPRVKSRMSEEKMVFHPYDAGQLEDILRSRAKAAIEDGILDAEVIPYCAALAARDTGDARMALDLLRISAEIAERSGENIVTRAHVRSAKNKIELDTTSEVIKTLTQQSKTVLMSIIYNTKRDKKLMTTGDVYSTYEELCNILNITPNTQRRITDLISELDMLGIVHARVKSFGRAGRTKEIELSIPDEICKMLENEESMSRLKNYRPPTQTRLM
ncbi:MAG: ORC1-type DNA replication protein [Methanomassiliicoccaceae archaeon]|nr:ORC1-type DNA replication protein [Methanomassiliicoccaceae archaeon]